LWSFYGLVARSADPLAVPRQQSDSAADCKFNSSPIAWLKSSSANSPNGNTLRR
jgi:hypothetical protein